MGYVGFAAINLSSARGYRDSEDHQAVYREPSNYNPLSTFNLAAGGSRHYQQQYADMYFLRLARLKPVVAEAAETAWEGFSVRSTILLVW